MVNLPKNYSSHFPKPKKEESEFGKGKKDLQICKSCNAIYWSKSWHHYLDDYPHLEDGHKINFTLCPACQMIKNKEFEGEVLIENVSKNKKELLNTIKNVGEEAFEKDVLDRIISTENKGNKIRVLTTENQLAVRIGKKIKKAFNADLEIKYSEDESVARVKIKI